MSLTLVLLLSLTVRLRGADWQLPWQFHPDEAHYTWKALDLIGDESLNPKYFRNPSLFTYLLYAQFRLLGFQAPKADEQAATADGLTRPPSGVAYVGRVNSALFGTATVAALAWIGWRLLGAWTAVTAAAFLGLAFIHVRDSHFATNDVPALFFLVLSVGCSLEVIRRGSLLAYVLAGLFGGLATSTKYNVGLFIVPLLVAHVFVCSRISSWSGRARASVPLLVAGAAAALAYLAGTPYTLITFDRFWGDFRTQIRLGGEGWEGQVPGPSGPLYLAALVQGVGVPIIVLSIVGLALMARRRPRETAVLAAFPIAYLLFMLRTELFFVRFALPLVPFLCLFAAVAVTEVAALLRRPSQRMAVGVGLAAAALLLPALNVLQHDMLISREDTRAQAARWAVENISPTAKVALEDYSIRDRRPRSYGGPAWELDTDLFNVNDVPSADPAAALRGPHHYFVVSSFQYDRFAGDTPKLARQTAFYDALERRGRLLATFGPGPAGRPVSFDIEDLYTPFWALERYDRPGPTIKIYEVVS